MTNSYHSVAATSLGVAATPRPVVLSDVSVRYPNGVQALQSVSLTIEQGEMVSVVGLSGSGKSTLIRAINGLVPVTSGTVSVGSHQVSGLRGKKLRQVRGHIGMIFQSFNLADRATVFSNVLVGRSAHTPTWKTFLGVVSQNDKAIIAEALDGVGMLDRAWTKAGALSGGQKQRVAIARAMAQQPSIMLADEPVASLDPPTAHSVMGDLLRINHDQQLTVVVNLHLMDLARRYTTRMIGLRSGQVVYDGPAATASDADFEAIYGRPIQSQDILGSPRSESQSQQGRPIVEEITNQDLGWEQA